MPLSIRLAITTVLLFFGILSFSGGLNRLVKLGRAVDNIEALHISEALALERSRAEAVTDISDGLIILVGGILSYFVGTILR
jgi:hypothetical protein